MNGITPFRAERALATLLVSGPKPAVTRSADNEQTITALNSSESNVAIQQQSDPLDLFGRFGQSVKALERLSNDIATLTELSQGLINPTQQTAIDRELEAQKAEVARITSSGDFQNAKMILQDVSRKLQQGHSRESITASLGEYTNLLGGGFFNLLQTAPSSVFSALSEGLAALEELSQGEPISTTDYSRKLDSILRNVTGILRGEATQLVPDEADNKASDVTSTSTHKEVARTYVSHLIAVA